jgi:hypothetical protein
VAFVTTFVKDGVADLTLEIPSVDIVGFDRRGTLELVLVAAEAGDLGDQGISILVRGLGPVKFLRVVAVEAVHFCLRKMDIRRLSLVPPIELRRDAPSMATPASLIRRWPLEELMSGEQPAAS